MGKGSKRRPMQVSQEEFDLRWDYAHDKELRAKISKEEFDERINDIRKRTGKP